MSDIKQFLFNKKQLEVIEAFKKGNVRLFLEGGRRSGKSQVAAYLIDWICTRTPGMEAYVYRDTFESIRKDTHRILEDKPGWLAGKGTWKNGHKEFHYANGSRIYFQYTKGSKHTLGQTAGLLYFEQVESIKEEDYDMILPVLSQYGPAAISDYMTKYGRYVRAGKLIKPKNYLLLTANPKANWVKSRYIDTEGLPDKINKTTGALEILDGLKREHILRIHLSTYDNIQNLPEEYQAYMDTASDAYKRQYFDGSWEFNTGLIYPEFSSEDISDGGNVVNFEWEAANDFKPSKYRTIQAIDPGYVKSKFACLMAAILTDGTIYFFDELCKNGKNVDEWEKIGPTEFGKELKRMWGEYKFTPNTSLIDSAAKDPNAGLGSVAGQLLKAGIPTTSARKTKEFDSIMQMKDLFKARKILVNARCQEFIRELGLFAWDERLVRKGEQQPLDADNDLCDCARYVINSTPHPQHNSSSYNQVLQKSLGPQNLMKNWYKEWYGVKTKKANPMSISNKQKGSWGI